MCRDEHVSSPRGSVRYRWHPGRLQLPAHRCMGVGLRWSGRGAARIRDPLRDGTRLRQTPRTTARRRGGWLGYEARELHSGFYRESSQRLRRFRGVSELLTAIRERGLRIVLASSAPQEELDILLKVLDVDDLIDETTTSSDVETAKPEPDVIETALARACVDASEAIMVGDARWDVEAAARAGWTPSES